MRLLGPAVTQMLAAQGFDLDDPRPRHRQQEARIGAVVDMTQIEDGNAVERVGAAGHSQFLPEFDRTGSRI